jgi:hypothetical protein
MKHTPVDAAVIIFSISSGMLSLTGLLLFVILWLAARFRHFLELLPFLVGPYLNLQNYTAITIAVSAGCVAVSTARYLKCARAKPRPEDEGTDGILLRQKKLTILSVSSLLLCLGNAVTERLWPWTYW